MYKLLTVLAALTLATPALAIDKRPNGQVSTIQQLNGSPEAGAAVGVSATKATLTGLTTGATYVVYCSTMTFFLPGSDVTAGVNGTSGQPIPAGSPMWITLRDNENSLSFITSVSTGTCYVNRWR